MFNIGNALHICPCASCLYFAFRDHITLMEIQIFSFKNFRAVTNIMSPYGTASKKFLHFCHQILRQYEDQKWDYWVQDPKIWFCNTHLKICYFCLDYYCLLCYVKQHGGCAKSAFRVTRTRELWNAHENLIWRLTGRDV